MSRRYNEKSLKEKIKELKALATGKETFKSIATTQLRPRALVVYEEGDGFVVQGRDKKLTQAEYDSWIEEERLKGPISSIIHLVRFGGTELVKTEETFPDGSVWKETLTYDQENQKDPNKQNNFI